jgi:REP element-mobilizing transposase RayT
VGGVSDADDAKFMTNVPFVRGRSAELRKGRISEAFGCYSITKVVQSRLPVLASDETAKILTDSWQYLRTNNRLKLFAFCIMPDHFHLAICLMPDIKLSELMKDSGKFTARNLNTLLGTSGQFWQEGFHDHHCRNEHELHELCSYIEHNPVRRGLVTAAELWPYSSAYGGSKHLLDREWWPSSASETPPTNKAKRSNR